MHDFVEIYIKLVIAIISFIAPLIVALLSVFSQGVGLMRKKGEVKLGNVRMLLHIETKGENMDPKKVKKAAKALSKTESEIEDTRNLLNPKRQIFRVFGPLLGSIILIMIGKLYESCMNSYYMNSEYGYQNNRTAYIVCIILSSLLAGWSMYVLRQVAWKVIETKDEINRREEEKELEKARGKILPQENN